ncbi:MAG: polysaccharide biosynthesis protein, partial [Spirochaetales bacterium]|nr:polysaccharide biosynthesis protein [Spirochaetales bacterium]
GSELLQQILCLPVRRIVAFGHGENSIHALLQTVGDDSRFEYIIGDVRDRDKVMCEVQRVKPDIIFHAAAHKHVPLMEEYPDEAVKNNIIGTYNCCLAAVEGNVKKFVLISTDKAVKPLSVMGASKRVAEQIVLSMNGKKSKTHFILTRFGNVLGSRGSVVPVFQRQIQTGGPVTVTHPEMTRFFMSVREAARLVIKAASLKNGNIFILDMGRPVKIIDLAKSMILLSGHTIDEIPIKISGIRPGEKLTEEILTDTEELGKTEFEKLFISEEKNIFYEPDELELLMEDFLAVAQTYDKVSIRKFIMEQIK